MSANLELLLEYVRMSKQRASIAGHQGLGLDDYHMGQAVAYQDIENILIVRIKADEQCTPG